MGEMPTASSLLSEWGAIVALLSRLMDLDATAAAFGALRRRRGVKSAESLLRLCMGYGPGGLSLRETALWAGVGEIATLKDTSLLKRLRNSVLWLAEILRVAMSAKVSPCPGAYRGRKVKLIDGTTLSKPGSTGTDWRLHAEYDLYGQRFSYIELTDKHTAEDLRHGPIETGEIIVADRGFAKLNQILGVVACGADFVIRTGWQSICFKDAANKPFKLFDILAGIKDGTPIDVPVFVQQKKMARPCPLRLIIIPRTPESAAAERAKILQRGRRKQHKTDERSLIAAGFIMILTSLGAEYSLEDVGALYRFRWQIELAFKRLKSILHIDALRASDPDLAQAWIYAHLIAAVIVDADIQVILESFPSGYRRHKIHPIVLADHQGGLPTDRPRHHRGYIQ